MKSSAVVDPRISGMYLSDYLLEMGVQEGSFFRFPDFEVSSLIDRIESWSLVNWNDLPDLFLRSADQSAALEFKVRLPHVFTAVGRCPRDAEHTETRSDDQGRTLCNHSNRFVVPFESIEPYIDYDKEAVKFRERYRSLPAPQGSLDASGRQVLVVERCDAVIDNRKARIPLKIVFAKENSDHNKIRVRYELKTESGMEVKFVYREAKDRADIPETFEGRTLAKIQEMVAFPYSHIGVAYLVRQWFMQEPKGTAPF